MCKVTITFPDGTRKTVSRKKARRHVRKGSDVEAYKAMKRNEQREYARRRGEKSFLRFRRRVLEGEFAEADDES